MMCSHIMMRARIRSVFTHSSALLQLRRRPLGREHLRRLRRARGLGLLAGPRRVLRRELARHLRCPSTSRGYPWFLFFAAVVAFFRLNKVMYTKVSLRLWQGSGEFCSDVRCTSQIVSEFRKHSSPRPTVAHTLLKAKAQIRCPLAYSVY